MASNPSRSKPDSHLEVAKLEVAYPSSRKPYRPAMHLEIAKLHLLYPICTNPSQSALPYTMRLLTSRLHILLAQTHLNPGEC